eukprot:TRINITY_DN739_c5_g1_i1.p1 TRINITY_DN739_c5_g1~~TRINITY_DN739_c5_g1_i1.p1  ORF type:complete len:600 (+),score=95.34 TRINITY_DN739_c5_g1_i1:731-2530(+)
MTDQNIPHPPDGPPRKLSYGAHPANRRSPFGDRDPPIRAIESAPSGSSKKKTNKNGKKRTSPSTPSFMVLPASEVEEEEEVRKMEMKRQLEAEMGRALTKYEAQAIMISKECSFEELKQRHSITTREATKRQQMLQREHMLPMLQQTEYANRTALERCQSTLRNELQKEYSITGRVVKFAAQQQPSTPIESSPVTPNAGIASRYIKTKKILGKGAFGTVFEGYDAETGKFIAIKEVIFPLVPQDKNVQIVADEVRLMKRLSHPNIVQYLGAERQHVTLHIYMELVPGGSISSALSYLDGGFPETTVRIYTKQICSGLQYLHDSGTIHRDIKGENILIDKANGVVKLADFNSSKSLEMSMNHGIRSLVGTPWFMAPEVIDPTANGYGLPADVWSLGIAVIEMLTGSPPFMKELVSPHQAIMKIAELRDPYPLPPGISDYAQSFLSCCLLRNPASRHTVSKLSKHAFVCSFNSLQGTDDASRAPKYQLRPLTQAPSNRSSGYSANPTGKQRTPTIPVNTSPMDASLSLQSLTSISGTCNKTAKLPALASPIFVPSPEIDTSPRSKDRTRKLLESRLASDFDYDRMNLPPNVDSVQLSSVRS